MARIPKKIKELARENWALYGLSDLKNAEELGVSHQTISKWRKASVGKEGDWYAFKEKITGRIEQLSLELATDKATKKIEKINEQHEKLLNNFKGALMFAWKTYMETGGEGKPPSSYLVDSIKKSIESVQMIIKTERNILGIENYVQIAPPDPSGGEEKKETFDEMIERINYERGYNPIDSKLLPDGSVKPTVIDVQSKVINIKKEA